MSVKSLRILGLPTAGLPAMPAPASASGKKTRLLFSNMAWSATGRAASSLAALLGNVLVARHLGAAEYGLLNYIVSFALLFQAIAQFGTDNIVTREIAKKGTSTDVILGTAIAVRICTSLVAFLALFICVLGFESDKRVALAILVFSLTFFLDAFLIVRSYFVATLANHFIALSEVLAMLLSVGAKVALVLADASTNWFLVAMVFDVFILSALLLVFYVRHGARLRDLRFSFGWAKYLVRESLPLILSLAAVMVHQRIDQVMLHNMAGSVAVGQFAAALKVVTIVLFLPQIIAETCSPLLVKARQHSAALFDRRFHLMSAVLLWSAIAGAVGASLVAGPIVRALFGPGFCEAVKLTRILAWKTVMVALSVSSAHWIIISGKQRPIVVRNLVGCAVNIALNLVLIPKYGATGASTATLFSFFCGSYPAHLLIPSYRPLFRLQTASIFKGPAIILEALLAQYRRFRDTEVKTCAR